MIARACGFLVLAWALAACGGKADDKPASSAKPGSSATGAKSSKPSEASAADTSALSGVYKITSYAQNKSGCDEKAATKAPPPSSHYFLVSQASGSIRTWSVIGCADVAACKAHRAEYEKGGSVDGEPYAMFGKAVDATKLEGGTSFAGKHKDGKCNELKKDVATFSLAGGVAKIESRSMVYETFDAADVSSCTVIDADKQKVKSSCAAITVTEASKVE